MDWGRVRFFFREVARNFSRNAIMQITAIGTVAVMIVILGGFIYARSMLATLGMTVVQAIAISAYLQDGIDARTERNIRAEIAHDSRVRSVIFVPKAQGLRELRARLRGQIDTSLLTSNPLPDAMRIAVVHAETVHAVAARIRKLPGVTNVVYAHDAVEKLLKVSQILARIGFVIVALLIATAAIIISNTIRLTVLARRREIAIMRLVGASSATIRAPFVCEGLVAGVLGAAIAIGVLVIARAQLLPKLASALPFVPITIGSSGDLSFALDLLGVGALLGLVASWASVGRYLRA